MKRKKIVILIASFIVLASVVTTGIVFAISNKDSSLLENLKAEDFDKIAIWQHNTCSSITGKENIDEFIKMVQSKKLKKLSEVEEKYGFLYSIEFYKAGVIVRRMVIGGYANIVLSDVSGEEIKTEYYDFDVPSRDEEYKDFIKFYNKFLDGTE